MKKYDEGYALPMVLVVILILCLVASYILSGALQTVTAQQDSIAQMKQEYAAQGKIEVLFSLLTEEAQMKDIEGDSEEALMKKIRNICIALNGNPIDTENCILVVDDSGLYTQEEGSTKFTFEFTVTSRSYNVVIETKMVLSGNIKENSGVYQVTNPSIDYETYKIGGVS